MSRQIAIVKQAFTKFGDMKEMLKEWYICPLCSKISELHAVNEQLREDGKGIFRQYFLSCYDVEKVSEKFAVHGTLPFVKHYHWFPSLRMLAPFRRVEHLCNVELFLSFETKQRNGLVRQRLMQRSDSYLVQAIALGGLSASIMRQAGGLAVAAGVASASESITDTSGVVRAATFNVINGGGGGFSGVTAGAGNSAFGMQVGTGTTANGVSTVALAALIATGVAAGQLSYGSVGQTDFSTAGSVTSFTLTRTFSNSSGAAITITESGVAMTGITSSGSGPAFNFLIIRDVLSVAVTVANGASTTGTYTIQVTTT